MRKVEKVFGINKTYLNVLHKKIGYNVRFQNFILNNRRNVKLLDCISTKKVDRLLKDYNTNSINFLKNNKTYRGFRHRNHLPARGQRTHTNAKTVKKIYK
jgi:small subunit ribosomal protein S13